MHELKFIDEKDKKVIISMHRDEKDRRWKGELKRDIGDDGKESMEITHLIKCNGSEFDMLDSMHGFAEHRSWKRIE